jgi:hypothetical protein
MAILRAAAPNTHDGEMEVDNPSPSRIGLGKRTIWGVSDSSLRTVLAAQPTLKEKEHLFDRPR